jgi:hypothetical protein
MSDMKEGTLGNPDYATSTPSTASITTSTAGPTTPHISAQDNSRAQPQQAEAPPQREPTQISGQPQPQQQSQVQSEVSIQNAASGPDHGKKRVYPEQI